jgi:stearoyl-CoA desaturase (delta-9 desaturase)
MESPESSPAPELARGNSFKPEHLFNLAGIAAMHFGAGVAIYMGARAIDVALAVGFYVLRMFVVTGGYHRYFSHRTYKTSRAFQFFLALVGTMTVQKGPLWWAAVHRRHHRESDGPNDVHSPIQRGFWYSHIGWVLSDEHEKYSPNEVKDLYKYPELRWLTRWHVVPVLSYLGLTIAIGGLRGLCWWFCVSTVALMHGTFTINSLSHVWGKRRYATTDDSRNNWVLAIITMGEGWHNNHHRYMQSTNQGFYWWEVDITYYILKALSFVGIVWDLKKPPQRVLDEGRAGNPAPFRDVVAAKMAEAKVKLADAKEKVSDAVDEISMPSPLDAE